MPTEARIRCIFLSEYIRAEAPLSEIWPSSWSLSLLSGSLRRGEASDGSSEVNIFDMMASGSDVGNDSGRRLLMLQTGIDCGQGNTK